MGAKSRSYEELKHDEEEFPAPVWRPSRVSLCSRLFFSWVTPLILLGKNRQINQNDLPPLEAGRLHGQELEVEPLINRFIEIHAAAPTDPLFKPLLHVFKRNIVIAWFFAVTEQACNLGNPVLLRWFLGSFNPDAPDDGSGYQLAFWMLFVSALQTFIGNHVSAQSPPQPDFPGHIS